MNKATLLAEVIRLPREERLQLIEDVWNSIVDDDLWQPTPDELAEARRRLEEHRRDPSTGIPAERLLERLQSRFE